MNDPCSINMACVSRSAHRIEVAKEHGVLNMGNGREGMKICKKSIRHFAYPQEEGSTFLHDSNRHPFSSMPCDDIFHIGSDDVKRTFLIDNRFPVRTVE